MLVCVVFKEIIMKILRSSDFHFFFLITALLCLSIKIGAAPRDATVSTRKRQLCLRVAEQREHFETLRMIFLNQFLAGLGHTFCRCLQSHRLGGRGQQKTLRV